MTKWYQTPEGKIALLVVAAGIAGPYVKDEIRSRRRRRLQQLQRKRDHYFDWVNDLEREVLPNQPRPQPRKPVCVGFRVATNGDCTPVVY